MGGEQPHFALVLPRNSWGDFAPPETPFPAMLEKALGRQEATMIMESLDKTLQKEWNEVLRYRPDLSYKP